MMDFIDDEFGMSGLSPKDEGMNNRGSSSVYTDELVDTVDDINRDSPIKPGTLERENSNPVSE